MNALAKVARILLINVVALVMCFALVEGGASLLFFTNQVVRNRGTTERHHSMYDATLGWVNRPNVHVPNLYGPGVSLRTNSQAFRNDQDFTPAVPPGKTRAVCSGDSFTLGFGVSNDRTWCRRLAARDPRLETVNMGQGGYGLDQAYLWYARDGVALDHQLHLLAFITDDFIRMQSERFLGYGKPLLGLRNDSLVVINQPVPKTSWLTRWWALQGHAIDNLSIVRLSRRVFRRDPARAGTDSADARQQATRAIASRVFETLARTNREKNSRLVLVYLPGAWDYKTNERTSSWRRFVQAEAARQGIPFVDVIEAFRRVPPADVDSLFLPNSHYSPAGNELVATTLYKELAAVLPDRLP